MMRRFSGIVLVLAVFVLVLTVFSVGITDGHITMDDWGYTYGCSFVRNGLKPQNILRAFTEIGYDAFWMPITFISYMGDISFFGGGWPIHHEINVIIHAVNTLIVIVLLRKLCLLADPEARGALIFACAGALIWALHPMRVEAVTYIASRKELLWSFFTLMGLVAWLRFLADGRRTVYFSAWICCFLACLSKPTAICFPFLAYLLEVFREKRLIVPKLVRYIPFLVVAFVVGAIIFYAQANPTDDEYFDVFAQSFAWRLLNAVVGFGMYLWHTLALSKVYFDYRAVFGGRPLDLGLGLSVFAIAGGLWLALIGFYRKDKGVRWTLLTMALWFFAALAPVSGIMGTVNGDHAYADRYTYLPFVGLAAIFVVLVSRLSLRMRQLLVVVVAIAASFESVYAVQVIRSFENDYTAFLRTLAKDPDHWRALRVVGSEYCARLGKVDEGIAMLERSLELRPSLRTAESLAFMLAIRGAQGDFDRVRVLAADMAAHPEKDYRGMMLDALGTVYFREGKDEVAVGFFKASLSAKRRDYSSEHTLHNLALVLANCGRVEEAVDVLKTLSRIPNPAVKTCATRILFQLSAGSRPRFAWTNTPF